MKTSGWIIGGAVAGAMFTGMAVAAETQLTGMVVYQVTPLSSVKLANGDTLQQSHLKGVILADEPAVLLDQNRQDCTGSSVTGPDGAEIEGSGSCVASDADGDTWSLWYHNRGDERTWAVISGTGKYEGMTGEGSTKVVSATPDGRIVITFGGTLQLKE